MKRFEVRATDGFQWFRGNIPCMNACPVRTEAYRYVLALARRDPEAAFAIARRPNPFPYVCGRVCGHPCEEACRRGKIDEPVSIRAMKRVATDAHVSALGHDYGLGVAAPREEAVAVIGSGPAGLACAHDLARLGYPVTIFEASPQAGGMLVLGIPEYRLPRDVVHWEIDSILALGVELKCNQALGRDFSLADLRSQGFRAVFIAVGAHRGKGLPLGDAHLDGVIQGVEFLLNVNLGYRVWLGHKVVVIGGGDVAMDSARTALRMAVEGSGGEEWEQYLALDAASAAARLGTEVHIVYRRSLAEMPAHVAEIYEAEEEGIQFHLLTNPVRVEPGPAGKLRGLWCRKMALGAPDASGRRSPVPIPGSDFLMPCDTVLLAVGQQPDLSFLREEDCIQKTPYGTIQVNPETMATTAPGVYAGGDCAFGPRLLIDAEGDGRKAARAIHGYLRGNVEWRGRAELLSVPLRDLDDPYDSTPRQACATLPLNRRVGFTEVELAFSADQAACEGMRCLRCHQNIFLDGERCILCGGCVDVCPYQCISMVSASQIDWIAAPEAAGPEAAEGEGYAMILDETRCIRCGLCVRRCPVDAITMRAFELEGEWVYG